MLRQQRGCCSGCQTNRFARGCLRRLPLWAVFALAKAIAKPSTLGPAHLYLLFVVLMISCGAGFVNTVCKKQHPTQFYCPRRTGFGDFRSYSDIFPPVPQRGKWLAMQAKLPEAPETANLRAAASQRMPYLIRPGDLRMRDLAQREHTYRSGCRILCGKEICVCVISLSEITHIAAKRQMACRASQTSGSPRDMRDLASAR